MLYNVGMLVRYATFAALLVVAWCVMAVTHELGHLMGGWLGGAVLQDCNLWPWHLPYSLHQPDPHPLLTLWAGPILGATLPVAIAAFVRRPWAWFIADFCVLANGCYLALAWTTEDRFLDTPRLLEAGASHLAIAVYCVVTIGIGHVRFRRDCVGLTSR